MTTSWKMETKPAHGMLAVDCVRQGNRFLMTLAIVVRFSDPCWLHRVHTLVFVTVGALASDSLEEHRMWAHLSWERLCTCFVLCCTEHLCTVISVCPTKWLQNCHIPLQIDIYSVQKSQYYSYVVVYIICTKAFVKAMCHIYSLQWVLLRGIAMRLLYWLYYYKPLCSGL